MRSKKNLPEFITLLQAQTKKLEDYHRPTTCPLCLLQMAMTFEADDRLREAAQISCHDFWNACIAAITTPRSDDDIKNLRHQLVRNIRACRTPNTHTEPPQLIARDITDPVLAFIHALYLLLNNCLFPTTGGHSALYNSKDPKKAFGNRSGLWPAKLSDLVPFGERQSAEAHLRWACGMFSPVPFMTLMTMTMGCRPIVFPSLLEPDLRERILWCLTQMLHADRGHDEFRWPESLPCTRPRRLPLWMCVSSRLSVELAVAYLDTILCGADSEPDDAVRFSSGFERALLPAINTALGISSDMGIRNSAIETTNLARWALLLYSRMDDPKSPLRDLHETARLEARRREEHQVTEMSPHKLIYTALAKVYSMRTCSAISCGKGVHQVASGKSLPLCSGCKFTQYCSKECQRADWKHEVWPHKKLCPLLSKWAPAFQQGLELEHTRPAMDVLVAQTEDDRGRLESWAISRGLVSTNPRSPPAR